jgi:tetratricopeptide (TPR) repeat protein
VATSFNNLAELYKSQGRYSEAEPLYQQALALRQKLLGDEHPDVATSFNNLALLYECSGALQRSGTAVSTSPGLVAKIARRRASSMWPPVSIIWRSFTKLRGATAKRNRSINKPWP